jgi:hypothetical protein
MTEQEEHFIHFSSSIAWLTNAWRLLQLIQEQSGNSLVGPAFRFALIEYCKPYKHSRGVIMPFKLDTRFIPNKLLPLHQRIVTSRDQVHAHSDLTLMEAKLSVHQSMGQRYSLIVQNRLTGVEELTNLAEVIALIEATLDNMYIEEKVLEAALPI